MRRTYRGEVLHYSGNSLTLREEDGRVRHFLFWSGEVPRFAEITAVGHTVDLRAGRSLGRSTFVWLKTVRP